MITTNIVISYLGNYETTPERSAYGEPDSDILSTPLFFLRSTRVHGIFNSIRMRAGHVYNLGKDAT